ncbi:MAG: SDR family NAD(P)-dependent oxidoreductase, partial [Chitinophagaceae bacterium]
MNRKTILITGAKSGLGFEAAKQLAKQGHEII